LQTEVERWWPNGIGRTQKLYQATVRCVPDTSDERPEKSNMIAFRTLRVVQDFVMPSDESKGLSHSILHFLSH